MTRIVKRLAAATTAALVVTAAGAAAASALRAFPATRALAHAAGDVVGAVVYAAQGPDDPGGFGPGPGGPGGRGRIGGPGGPGPAGPGDIGALLGAATQRLGLNEAQQQQLKAVVQSHGQEMQEIAKRQMAARGNLDKAIESDTFDEGAIRAATATAATADADAIVLRARVRWEAIQILTPEQRAQLKDVQADLRQRQAQMRQQQQQQRLPRPPQ